MSVAYDFFLFYETYGRSEEEKEEEGGNVRRKGGGLFGSNYD